MFNLYSVKDHSNVWGCEDWSLPYFCILVNPIPIKGDNAHHIRSSFIKKWHSCNPGVRFEKQCSSDKISLFSKSMRSKYHTNTQFWLIEKPLLNLRYEIASIQPNIGHWNSRYELWRCVRVMCGRMCACACEIHCEKCMRCACVRLVFAEKMLI